jgi:CheY-like chemotaxis protein
MATILIVEDNPSVAKFYALALERRGGMKCLLAHTAEEVLGSAQGGQIALVLLDVSLANFTYQGRPVDGLQLSRMLKEDPKTRHLPILLATAHAMVGDRERFLAESKADDYLQKPIYDSEILVQKVKELLAKANG